MELVVACVLAYYLMRHGPQLVAEALAEADYTHRGQMSPRAAARAKRLADAGIDPAVGGAARQFLGNVWRDAWLDLDDARARRRNERDADPAGERRTFRDRFDDAVNDLGERWRRRSGSSGDPADATTDPPTEPDTPSGDTGPTAAPAGETVDTPPDDPPATSRQPDPEPPPADEPIRVPSTQGEPYRRPPAPEGDPAMAGTAVVHVTGVSSAAHEARNIANQISAVTEAYKAAMEQILRRAQNLGQSTVGEIQQALSSHTVAAIQAACEAIAAAKAHAAAVEGEAAPAMYRVARAFERIV